MEKIGKKIFLLMLWSFYFVAVVFLLRFYFADVNFKKSQDLVKDNNAEKALLYADKSIVLNPHEAGYFRGRAKINTVLLVDAKTSDLLKEEILSDLQKAYEMNPKNLVVIRNSVSIYYFLAVKDLYIAPGKDNIDEKYIEVVRRFYDDTKKNYWNDAGVISLVAKYEKRLGLEDGYAKSVERVGYLRPDLLNWHESFR